MNNNFMGYFNPPPGSMNSGPGFPPGSLGPQGTFGDMPVNMGSMMGPTNTLQQRLSHYENMQMAQVPSAGAQPRLQPYMNVQQSNPFGAVSGMSAQGMPQFEMRMPNHAQESMNLQSGASYLSSMQQWPRMPSALLRHKQLMMQHNMEQGLASLPSNEEMSFGSPQPFSNNDLVSFNKLQSQDEPQPLPRQSSIYNNFPFGPQPFGNRASLYQSYEAQRLQQANQAMPSTGRQGTATHYPIQRNPLNEQLPLSSLSQSQNSMLFRSSTAKTFGDDLISKVQPQTTPVPPSPKLSHFGPSPNTSVFDIPGSHQRMQKMPGFQQSPPFVGNEAVGKGMGPGIGPGIPSRLQPDSSPVLTPPRSARLPSPSRMSSPTKLPPIYLQMQQLQQRICQLQESHLPEAGTHLSLLQQQFQSLYRQSLLQKSNSDFGHPSMPNKDRGLSAQLSPLHAMSMQLSPLQASSMQPSPMCSSPAQNSPLSAMKRTQDEHSLLDFQNVQTDHPNSLTSVCTSKQLTDIRTTSPLNSGGGSSENIQGINTKDNSNSLSSIEKITSISNIVDLSSTPTFDPLPRSNAFAGLPNDSDFSPSPNIPLTHLSNIADEIGMEKLPVPNVFSSDKHSSDSNMVSAKDNKLQDLKELSTDSSSVLLDKIGEASPSQGGQRISLPFNSHTPNEGDMVDTQQSQELNRLSRTTQESEEPGQITTEKRFKDKDHTESDVTFANELITDEEKQQPFSEENFLQQDSIVDFSKKEDAKVSQDFLRQSGSQGLFEAGGLFPGRNMFENGSGFDVGQPFDAKSIFDADSLFDSKGFLESDPSTIFDKRDLLDTGLQLDIGKTVGSNQTVVDTPNHVPPAVSPNDVGKPTSVIQMALDKPKPKGKTIKNTLGAKGGGGKGKGKGGGKGKTGGKSSGKGGRQRKTTSNGKKRKSSDSESYGSPAHSPSIMTTDPLTGETVDLDSIKRRSLRERRKKNYKDDFDYNLSDEDEQKKKKGDVPPDGHKLIPYRPSEAVEGEIAIVEKILATRIRQSLSEDGKPLEEPEYFVKYKGYSYLHCEWGTPKELMKKDRRVAMKVKRFNSKGDSVAFWNQLDDEPFNPDYVEIDRVLDMSTCADQVSGEAVTHYLVKWVGLPYEDSTWELEMNVDEPKVEQYIELKKPPPVEMRKTVQRPQPCDWQKIDKSPVYKNSNVLREYQLEGLNWLLFCWYKSQNCILADEMGLGKTIQSITFLCAIKQYGIRGPFLVIAPLSTISNWHREFETWSDINAIVYHGTAPSRQLIQQYEMYYQDEKGERIPELYKFEAVITTYEMILSDNNILNTIPWRCLVIDEAHRLKNRNCKLLEGLNNLEVEHRVLLTGTPLQNNVEELFSLLNFLEPTRFPSQAAFLVEFGDLKTEAQVDRLQQILKPMMLRRLKEDVEKNIAPKEETIIEVELTTIQKKIYRAILEKNFSFLSKGASATNIPNLMNTMMELRKCCNHPFLITGAEERIVSEYALGTEGIEKAAKQFKAMIESSGKMVLIDKLLPKLKAGGHKVLIFSQMIRVLDLIEDYLLTKRHAYERIDGRVRGNMRQVAIDRFCRPDSDRFVFLLCTRAGGLGINLTAADTVIIFDSDWNPQNDLQAQARCHRIGQEKSVKVYRLICRNTYEREMFDRASLKLGLDKAILQNMNAKEGTPSAPQQPAMSKKEIEDLLKKGAYGAIMDQEDKDASSKFCEEDIDLILERRTQVIQIVGEGKGSTFAKASFVSDKARLDIDLDDPDFWKKWAKKAAVDMDELCQDNLIIDKPRQRKQTRRFGNEDGPLDLSDFDSDDDAAKIEPPARTSWTRVECFKVEKNLLVYGWGRWKEIIAYGHFRLQMTEKEVEAIARSILAYCQHHFKGDEKTKQFIVTLIEQSAINAGVPVVDNDEAYLPAGNSKLKSKKRKKGKPKKAQYSKPAIIEVGMDWKGLEQESIVIDAGYRKHLQHHCNKILSRVRLLYCLWHDILGDVSEKVRGGCHVNSVEFPLPYSDGDKPASWWDDECDKSLLVGVYKHGYERYSQICCDKNLFFAERLGISASSDVHPSSPGDAGLEKCEDSNDPDFVSPKRKKKRQAGQGEDDEDNSDDSSDFEKESNIQMPSPSSVSSKDAASTETVGASKSGLQMPLASDLNTRLRRLIAGYLRNCEKEHLTQMKAEKDKERREKIAQQAKNREAKKAVMAQKWSRREESDFYRVISTFGVVYNPKEKTYDWTKFRHLARLDKKDDDRITAYYEEFMAMCRRVCGKPSEEDSLAGEEGKGVATVTAVSEERANRCLQRVHLLRTVREEVLPHEKLDERVQLCQRSSEFPPWWENGKHDKELLVGVAKHGVGRTDYHLFTDPDLCFKEILDSAGTSKGSDGESLMEASGQSTDAEEGKLSDEQKDTELMEDTDTQASDAKEADSSKTTDKENEPSQGDGSDGDQKSSADNARPVREMLDDPEGRADFFPPTITDEAAEILSAWPKDRIIINRIEKVAHCVLHGFWLKGVRSLDAAIARLHSQHVSPLAPNVPPVPAIDRPNLVSGEPMSAIDEEMKARGKAEYAAGLNDKDFKIKRVSMLDGLKLTVKKHKKRRRKDIELEDGALGKLSIVPPPETAFSSRSGIRAELSEKLTKKILKRAALDEMLTESPVAMEPMAKSKRARRKRKAGDIEPMDMAFSPPLVDEVQMGNEDLMQDAMSQIKVPMISTLHIPRVNSSEHKSLPGAAVRFDDAMSMLVAEKRGLIQVHYPKLSTSDDQSDISDRVKGATSPSSVGGDPVESVPRERRLSSSNDDSFSPSNSTDYKYSSTKWQSDDSPSHHAMSSPQDVPRDITWKEILRGTSTIKKEAIPKDPPVLVKNEKSEETDAVKGERDRTPLPLKATIVDDSEDLPLPRLKEMKPVKFGEVGQEHNTSTDKKSRSSSSPVSATSFRSQDVKLGKGVKDCRVKLEPSEDTYESKVPELHTISRNAAKHGEGYKKGVILSPSRHTPPDIVSSSVTSSSKKDHRRHTPKPSPEPSRVLPRREASVEASRLITAQEKGYVLPKLQPAGCYSKVSKAHSPPNLKTEDKVQEDCQSTILECDHPAVKRGSPGLEVNDLMASEFSVSKKSSSIYAGSRHSTVSSDSKSPNKVGGRSPALTRSTEFTHEGTIRDSEVPGVKKAEKATKNFVIPKLSRAVTNPRDGNSSSHTEPLFEQDSKRINEPRPVGRPPSRDAGERGTAHPGKQNRKKIGTKQTQHLYSRTSKESFADIDSTINRAGAPKSSVSPGESQGSEVLSKSKCTKNSRTKCDQFSTSTLRVSPDNSLGSNTPIPSMCQPVGSDTTGKRGARGSVPGKPMSPQLSDHKSHAKTTVPSSKRQKQQGISTVGSVKGTKDAIRESSKVKRSSSNSPGSTPPRKWTPPLSDDIRTKSPRSLSASSSSCTGERKQRDFDSIALHPESGRSEKLEIEHTKDFGKTSNVDPGVTCLTTASERKSSRKTDVTESFSSTSRRESKSPVSGVDRRSSQTSSTSQGTTSSRPKLKLDAIVAKLSTSASASKLSSSSTSPELGVATSSPCGVSSKKLKDTVIDDALSDSRSESHSASPGRGGRNEQLPQNATYSSRGSRLLETAVTQSKGRKSSSSQRFTREATSQLSTTSDTGRKISSPKSRKDSSTGRLGSTGHHVSRTSSHDLSRDTSDVKHAKRARLGTVGTDTCNDNCLPENECSNSPSSTVIKSG